MVILFLMIQYISNGSKIQRFKKNHENKLKSFLDRVKAFLNMTTKKILKNSKRRLLTL